MVIKQKLVECLTSEDPYSLFLYAMNSPVTRDRYTTILNRFFSFIGIEGSSIEERCRVFVEKGRNDSDWMVRNIRNCSRWRQMYASTSSTSSNQHTSTSDFKVKQLAPSLAGKDTGTMLEESQQ